MSHRPVLHLRQGGDDDAALAAAAGGQAQDLAVDDLQGLAHGGCPYAFQGLYYPFSNC
jgi:hypothetical protein